MVSLSGVSPATAAMWRLPRSELSWLGKFRRRANYTVGDLVLTRRRRDSNIDKLRARGTVLRHFKYPLLCEQ